MGASQVSKRSNLSDIEPQERSSYKRLGIYNGLLIGSALALGAWLADIFFLTRLPIPIQLPSFLLGSVLLILICTLTGWLTSRWAKPLLTFIIWLIAAFLATLVIIYQPYYGRTVVAWLSDLRFWGLPIFPQIDPYLVSIFLAGFAIFLILLLLAVVQNFRLESAQRELREDDRLSSRSLFILLWPLLFVALAGWITNNIAGDKSVRDAILVQEAIDTAQTYDGDLFQLGLERGVSYVALNSVRDQLSPNYSLLIGGIDNELLITSVVAHFSNGSWVTCRVINGQLNFCYDAAPPYTIGLKSLITGEPVPEDCLNCLPQVADATAGWLIKQGENFGEDVQVDFVAQLGGYVLMRAVSEDGDQAIECLFNELRPVKVESCELVSP